MIRASPQDWSDEQVADLDRLWRRGETASAIGRALGKTKNSVIGKAHRLKLPGRPSPLGLTKSDRARARGEALPKPTPPARLKPAIKVAAPKKRRPFMTPEPPPRSTIITRPCRWPMWDDVVSHVYCGEQRRAGSSYCPEHHKKAHTTGVGWGQRMALKKLEAL